MKIILKKKDNISFDTNDFDISFIRGLSLEDGAATLIAFTAKLVSSKIDDVLKEHKNEKIKILICGGGRKKFKFSRTNKIEFKKKSLFSHCRRFQFKWRFYRVKSFCLLGY